MSASQFIILLSIGLVAGILAGSLGVGGGLVIVPSLVFILGMTQHQAQGTSLAMMLAPIGILAAVSYFKEGYINVRYAVILAVAFIAGAYIGSLIAVNLPDQTLKKAFGVLMLLAGARMIFGK